MLLSYPKRRSTSDLALRRGTGIAQSSVRRRKLDWLQVTYCIRGTAVIHDRHGTMRKPVPRHVEAATDLDRKLR